MFKLIGFFLKCLFFSAVVLIAAHYVTWNGRTVSDQVRETLSSADRSVPIRTIRKTSKSLLRDAREAASHVGIRTSERRRKSSIDRRSGADGEPGDPAIPTEDRRRLQALIHSSDEG